MICRNKVIVVAQGNDNHDFATSSDVMIINHLPCDHTHASTFTHVFVYAIILISHFQFFYVFMALLNKGL
jgi:hypothetical protein